MHKMPSTNANEYSLESKPVIDLYKIIQFNHLDQSVPSMAVLVNEYLYFIFAVIGFSEKRVKDWLALHKLNKLQKQ